MTTDEQAVNLYWAYTDDHDEDWFVFAASAREARAFHEEYEGYGRGDARARLVVSDVPLKQFMNGPVPCHAQIPELLDLNFEVVGTDPDCRAVKLNGKVFMEGVLESLVEMARGNLAQAAPKNGGIQLVEVSSRTASPSSGIPATGTRRPSLRLVERRRG